MSDMSKTQGAATAAAPIHRHRRRVAFQEADAAGVVFFARFLDYFHDAYVDFLRARGLALEAAFEDGTWMAPVRRAEADYRRPLRFGDEIDVSIVRIEVGNTEFTLHYRVDTAAGLACEGVTRHVSVDHRTFRRVEIPTVLRRALESRG